MKHNMRKSVQGPCLGIGRWPVAALFLGGLLMVALPAGAADRVGSTDLKTMSIHGATVGMTEAEAIAKWKEAGFTQNRRNFQRQRPDGRDTIIYKTVVPWEKAKNGPSPEDREWLMARCDGKTGGQKDYCLKMIEKQLSTGSPTAFSPPNRLVYRIEYRQLFDDSTPIRSEEVIKQLEDRFGDVDDAGGTLLYVDDIRKEQADQAMVDKCVQSMKGSVKSLLRQDVLRMRENIIGQCYPDSLDTQVEAARYMGARTLTIRVGANRQNQIYMDFRWPYLEGKRSLSEKWAKSHGETHEKSAQMSF
jgi:hypothetical protein